MRVFHVLKTSIGALWALKQIRELVQLGVECHVTLPAGGPLVSDYRRAGASVYLEEFSFPTHSPWQLARILKDFRALVEFVKPDIIHSYFVSTTLTARLALGKKHPIPRVFQVPGPLHLENLFFRNAEIASAGPLDYWVGTCQWTVNRYEQSGIDGSRLFLVYFGTNMDDFGSRRPGKLRQELQLDPRTKVVGMVAFMYAPKYYLGQTRGLKGHEDLIDALRICLTNDPNIVGVFVGGAWNNAVSYENRVRAYGKERCGDKAIFLGTRNDVPDLYPDFDVAVHPSHSENVGGATESLLMGIPTIATDVGGFPDLIQTGKTGWLVPKQNPAALAEAITEALHNRGQALVLANEGRQRARELFDVKQTSKNVLTVYESILR